MAPNNTQLEHAELEKFLADMHTNHDFLEQQIGKVDGHKQDLAVHMKTTSASGQALQNAANSFVNAARQMNKTLLDNAEKLRGAQKKYAAAEDHNAHSVAGVGNQFLDQGF